MASPPPHLLCLFLLSVSFLLRSFHTHAIYSPPPPQILVSPDFFLSNHARMLSAFKIFIYPPADVDDLAARNQSLSSPQNVQDFFFCCLSQSRFVTKNAEAAHLYFIPASLDAMHRKKSGSLGRNLRDLVQQLRDEYPFWQRTLGTDHFLVVCRRFSGDGSRNVLELQKNSISVACPELFGEGTEHYVDEEGMDLQFFPHKDIVMPPYHAHTHIQDPDSEPVHRPRLVYVLDPSNSVARKLWGADLDFVFDSKNPSETLQSSKFCLTFSSVAQKKKNISLIDAMRAECVPVVIISDGRLLGLPFQNILDWSKFSVIASHRRLEKLKSYLESMPETKYRELQRNAIAASTHLQWHLPPRPYDAFYMLMHQLWLGRHSIRYTRRGTLLRSAS